MDGREMLKAMQNMNVSIEIESEKDEVKIPNNDKWGSDQVKDVISRIGVTNRTGTDTYIKPGKPMQAKTNISR